MVWRGRPAGGARGWDESLRRVVTAWLTATALLLDGNGAILIDFDTASVAGGRAGKVPARSFEAGEGRCC